ncbi:MAG: tetratricopeptide repeat protein [Actinomycetota bacterium]
MRLFDRTRKTIEAAAAARRDGDAPAAIDLLADVLDADPAHVAANAEMARALRLIGDPAEAEAYYRVALEGVLEYSLVVELSEALVEQGKVADAETVLDAALVMAQGNPRLDPGEALIVRATIALAQQRTGDAAEALDLIVPKRASKRTKALAASLRERLSGQADT